MSLTSSAAAFVATCLTGVIIRWTYDAWRAKDPIRVVPSFADFEAAMREMADQGSFEFQLEFPTGRVTEVAWEVVATPQGWKSGDVNDGGMAIRLVPANDGEGELITIVAFERANSLHPDVSFQDQFDVEMEIARTAVEAQNKLFEGAGELQ